MSTEESRNVKSRHNVEARVLLIKYSRFLAIAEDSGSVHDVGYVLGLLKRIDQFM